MKIFRVTYLDKNFVKHSAGCMVRDKAEFYKLFPSTEYQILSVVEW